MLKGWMQFCHDAEEICPLKRVHANFAGTDLKRYVLTSIIGICNEFKLPKFQIWAAKDAHNQPFLNI
jgi:hypothetical protein